jgi:hypothetical protein
MDVARALLATCLVLAAAVPVGGAALRLLGFRGTDLGARNERLGYALAIGLGMLALFLTLAGLARLLYPVAVLAGPVVLAVVAWPLSRPLLAGPTSPRPRGRRSAAPEGPPAFTPLACRARRDAGRECADLGTEVHVAVAAGERAALKVTTVALTILAAAVLIQCMAPPTDYDGLLYHLVAPRVFLAAHGIEYIPHNFSANLPMLGEMLYTVGLAAGTDRMPQMLHAATGALCVWLTYTFGRERFGRRAAWWAAAGVAVTPLLPFLATRAYIDLFTLLFSLVAIAGVIRWHETHRAAWLRLAGVATGLALSTKYAAVMVGLVAGACILVAGWLTARRSGERRLPARQAAVAALRPAAAFAALATVVALPWYLRQTLALGNPIWPMYFGGRDWDGLRVEQLTYFISQYGAGRTIGDWLRLPWNVYTQSWRFGHVPDAYPPILALAAPLALRQSTGSIRWVAAIAGALCLLWAQGWQDLRFLLPAYPMLALLGAAALVGRRSGVRYGSAFTVGIVTLSAVLAAAQHGWRAVDAMGVIFGREPVAAYLERKLPDQRAINYLNRVVGPGDAALFLGDGQIWYCRPRCIPDPAHDVLLQWFVRPPGESAVIETLRGERVTHILLSRRDFWYLEHQDPEERLKEQLAAFYTFKAKHLDLVYADNLTEVYRGRW